MDKCKHNTCYKKVFSREYCSKHYQQIYRHGKILERTCRDPNEIVSCGTHYEVILRSKKQQIVGRAIIDLYDVIIAKKHKWGLDSCGYASNGKVRLHTLILGKQKGLVCDHINKNKLDNRRVNLRHVTPIENCRNLKSKGYYWYEKKKRWVVQITVNRKCVHIGSFEHEADAIQARKLAEREHW